MQVLTDMMEFSGAEVLLWLAVRVEGALAMLAYARAELLWWFRHWKEVTHVATLDTYCSCKHYLGKQRPLRCRLQPQNADECPGTCTCTAMQASC